MIQRKYREIVLFKTLADLKAEARRSYLGLLWWFLEPVLYMMAFYLVFAVLLNRGGEGYVVFLLVGLVVFKWFGSAVRTGVTSVSRNAGLIQQVYLPKEVFIYVTVLVTTSKFLIIYILLMVFVLLTQGKLAPSWIVLPFVLAVQFLFVLAVTGLVAALTPFVPDLKVIIENGLMLLLFVSGIFFDINSLPSGYKEALLLNPIALLIDSHRTVMIDGGWPSAKGLTMLAVASAIGWTLVQRLLRRLDKVYPKLLLR